MITVDQSAELREFHNLAHDLQASGFDKANISRLLKGRDQNFNGLTSSVEQVINNCDGLGFETREKYIHLVDVLRLADAHGTKILKDKFDGLELDSSNEKLKRDLKKIDQDKFLEFAQAVINASRTADGKLHGLNAKQSQDFKDRVSRLESNPQALALDPTLASNLAALVNHNTAQDAAFKFKILANLAKDANEKAFWLNIVEAVNDIGEVLGLLETVDWDRSAASRFSEEHVAGLSALERLEKQDSITRQLSLSIANSMGFVGLTIDSISTTSIFKKISEALEAFAEAHQKKRAAEEKAKKQDEAEYREQEVLRAEVRSLLDRVPLAIRQHLLISLKDYSDLKVQHQYQHFETFVDGINNSYGAVDDALARTEQAVEAVKLGMPTFEMSYAELKALRQLLGQFVDDTDDRRFDDRQDFGIANTPPILKTPDQAYNFVMYLPPVDKEKIKFN